MNTTHENISPELTAENIALEALRKIAAHKLQGEPGAFEPNPYHIQGAVNIARTALEEIEYLGASLQPLVALQITPGQPIRIYSTAPTEAVVLQQGKAPEYWAGSDVARVTIAEIEAATRNYPKSEAA